MSYTKEQILELSNELNSIGIKIMCREEPGTEKLEIYKITFDGNSNIDIESLKELLPEDMREKIRVIAINCKNLDISQTDNVISIATKLEGVIPTKKLHVELATGLIDRYIEKNEEKTSASPNLTLTQFKDLVQKNSISKKFNKNFTYEIIDKVEKTNEGNKFDYGQVRLTGVNIDNVTELDKDDLAQMMSELKLEELNINVNGDTYNLETYLAILDELHKLVDDIDMDLSEKQRFGRVLERVCIKIQYDTAAAYPCNEEEKRYSEEVSRSCRNLKNGLLENKCVCAGYANILRNALLLVGIENEYVGGDAYQTEEQLNQNNQLECIRSGNEIEYKWIGDKNKYKNKFRQIEGKTGLFSNEGHAWNKVKLDGVWSNADATWCRDAILQRRIPEYALMTDKQREERDQLTDFGGPECSKEVSEYEMKIIFAPPWIREVMDMVGNQKMSAIEVYNNLRGKTIFYPDVLQEVTRFSSKEELSELFTMILQEGAEEEKNELQFLINTRNRLAERMKNEYGMEDDLKYYEINWDSLYTPNEIGIIIEKREREQKLKQNELQEAEGENPNLINQQIKEKSEEFDIGNDDINAAVQTITNNFEKQKGTETELQVNQGNEH